MKTKIKKLGAIREQAELMVKTISNFKRIFVEPVSTDDPVVNVFNFMFLHYNDCFLEFFLAGPGTDKANAVCRASWNKDGVDAQGNPFECKSCPYIMYWDKYRTGRRTIRRGQRSDPCRYMDSLSIYRKLEKNLSQVFFVFNDWERASRIAAASNHAGKLQNLCADHLALCERLVLEMEAVRDYLIDSYTGELPEGSTYYGQVGIEGGKISLYRPRH